MIEFSVVVALVALGASWVICLGYKWGIIEYWQTMTRFEIINKMLNCHFCLSWWVCVVLSLAAVVLLDDLVYIIVPIFSTNITKNII